MNIKPCPFCDAIPEPDTLYIRMMRGERRIANELRKQFGEFKRVVIDVSGERHEFSADSLVQMLEDYESSNTRAERTCKANMRSEHDANIAYFLSCGHVTDWELEEPPAYCPECGAKVVEK